LNPSSFSDVDKFQTQYDVSARLEGGKVVLNSLADLARRECRFQHSFANPSLIKNWPNIKTLVEFDTTRAGEDIILTHAIGFDLKVWDPDAPVTITTNLAPNLAVLPGDFGYNGTGSASSFGAYVDLGYASNPATKLSGGMQTNSKLPAQS